MMFTVRFDRFLHQIITKLLVMILNYLEIETKPLKIITETNRSVTNGLVPV
ncbi:hypothetical protein HanRHA438_Chr03g0104981 [Helianthus annuus]|nr:hypothetical protein HanIR_Chr03g0102481 [Helianthus annuus]KAJ0934221.1 hypothetical protein HanRHA438_Chr03g0104981 [Helianthus annuus]